MNFRKAIFPFTFCLLAAGAAVKLLAIREALLQINPNGILLLTVAVLILLWGHGIRAYKATLLVQPIKILTWLQSFRSISVAFAFNLFLPFRLGEVARLFYLKQEIEISAGFLLTTLVVERCFDLFSLLSAFLMVFYVSTTVGMYEGKTLELLAFLSPFVFLTLAFVVAIFVFAFVLDREWGRGKLYQLTGHLSGPMRTRVLLSLWTMMQSSRLLFKEVRWQKYIFWTFLMWATYFLGVLVLIHSQLTFRPSLASMAFSSIGAFLSSLGVNETLSAHAFSDKFQNFLIDLPPRSSLGTDLGLITWAVLFLPSVWAGAIAFLVRSAQTKVLTSDHSRQPPLSRLAFSRGHSVESELSAFLDAYFSKSVVRGFLAEYKGHGIETIQLLTGGSRATTILCRDLNGYFVQKGGIGTVAQKLRAQYEWLERHQNCGVLPRLRSEVIDRGEYFAYQMEYISHGTPFFDYAHKASINQVYEKFEQTWLSVSQNIHQQPASESTGWPMVLKYIEQKGFDKLATMEGMSDLMPQLIESEEILINGDRQRNIKSVLNEIVANPERFLFLGDFKPSEVHGDLTVDNLILTRDGRLILMDPNNENGISAPVLDAAKFLQSVRVGYEFLKCDESARLKETEIWFNDIRSHRYALLEQKVLQLFERTLPPAQFKALDFHLGMHLIRLLPYRINQNPKSLIALYGQAVLTLNRFLVVV